MTDEMDEHQKQLKDISEFLAQQPYIKRGFVLYEGTDGILYYDNHPGMKRWEELFELVDLQFEALQPDNQQYLAYGTKEVLGPVAKEIKDRIERAKAYARKL